jgi:hypothetical protein
MEEVAAARWNVVVMMWILLREGAQPCIRCVIFCGPPTAASLLIRLDIASHGMSGRFSFWSTLRVNQVGPSSRTLGPPGSRSFYRRMRT